jgi:hypothetical protein
VLLFAFCFLMTFWRPLWVETFAASFIKGEVAAEVHARIDSLGFSGASETLSKMAGAIYRTNQQQIEKYKSDLKARADQRIAACIAQMLDLRSETRERIAQVLEAGTLNGIESLTTINERLTDVIQGSYLRVVGELKRDLRIFTATNFCCFLLLLLATFLRPPATAQLFVPGMLLLAATLYCSYAYVFEQNWLLTIIYSDYLGFGYLGCLALTFLFQCDVVFNRGRASAALVGAIVGVPVSPVHRPRT